MSVKSTFVAFLLICFASGFNLAQQVNCSNVDEWQSSSFYGSGDQVVRFGFCYESKWGNSSTNPETNNGEWSVWTAMGKCDDYRSEIEFVSPENSSVIDVAGSGKVEFDLFVEDSLNITSMDVRVLDSKVKLTFNAGLWSGYWRPEENGVFEVMAEAKDISGNLFTAQISIEVKGFVNEEIIVTYFFPTNGGVYEPNKSLYFQVEAYDKRFKRDVLSVHFEIDTVVKEAVYDAQLKRWGANISMPSIQGDYVVKAIAKDNSGNKVVEEIKVKVKEKVDNKPPIAIFIQPKNGELVVPDVTGFFKIRFSAWDPDGELKFVSLNIDNQPKIDFPSVTDSLFEWDWQIATSGWHELTLEVEDNLGEVKKTEISIVVLSLESCYLRWNAFRTYYGGEIVSYNGANYMAKWWNYQANPEVYSGSWDCWELMGPCLRNGKDNEAPKNNIAPKGQRDIVLFPNPVEDILNFRGVQEATVEVEIRDVTGNLMIHKTIKTEEAAIQITELSSGTYIASFKIGSEIIRKNFIKN